MNLDFVDIGTSDFDIADGVIQEDKTYLLVEPVIFYLNNLPNTSNITKANFAISDREDIINVFYVEEKNILKYNLPHWVRGCNKINERHPTIVNLLSQLNIAEDIITCSLVQCITFAKLLDLYKVTHINNLKIDTEGHDHIVFKTVVDCLLNSHVDIEKIKLEYLPIFGNTKEIDIEAQKLLTHYPVQKIIGEDLYLSKE
jgi:hypothetical protein